MEKIWKPLAGGAILASAGSALLGTSSTLRADSITTTTGFNAPVLTGSQAVIASYYVTGNPTTSSASYNGTNTDPTIGLDSYAGAYADYLVGDVHGNPYDPGQSFTTGSKGYVLNSIGYALGDAESAAGITTASETMTIYKLNTDGTLTSVYSSTTTGTPFVLVAAKKNTQFNFSSGVTLAANTTYVFALSVNSTDNVSLLIQASGTNSNPGGTTKQQLVDVKMIPNANSTQAFLTYSGYSSRNNESGETAPQSVADQTDTQYSSGTTKIFSPSGSPNISGTTKLGIFNGANSLGIDQFDFYVIGTPIAAPEPASIGLLGMTMLGLLKRRNRST